MSTTSRLDTTALNQHKITPDTTVYEDTYRDARNDIETIHYDRETFPNADHTRQLARLATLKAIEPPCDEWICHHCEDRVGYFWQIGETSYGAETEGPVWREFYVDLTGLMFCEGCSDEHDNNKP